jgi:excisionase family DNA binding protein
MSPNADKKQDYRSHARPPNAPDPQLFMGNRWATLTHSKSHRMRDKTTEKYLTVKEFAAVLRVSTTAVYRIVERRDIPFYRFTRKLRFAMTDVEEYLRKSRVEMIEKPY